MSSRFVCSDCGWLHIQGWISEQAEHQEHQQKHGCGEYLSVNCWQIVCRPQQTSDALWVLFTPPGPPHYLFRLRWMPLLSTAHRQPRQPPMGPATMLPTARAALPPELPGRLQRGPLKSPTRRTLTRNLLLMDSPSQAWVKEMVSNISKSLAVLSCSQLSCL